jgi:F0F1-type ATP synthase membrane subunit b/b'
MERNIQNMNGNIQNMNGMTFNFVWLCVGLVLLEIIVLKFLYGEGERIINEKTSVVIDYS